MTGLCGRLCRGRFTAPGVVAVLLLAASAAADDVEVTLEAGVLGFSYNEAQIPNSNAGDRFDVTTVAGDGPIVYGRLSIQRTFADRHIVRGVYAPVRIEGIGAFDEPVRFAGEEFDADDAISGLYQFNTYRLTYRYRFVHNEDWSLGAGVTGLVRDANIRLVQGSTRAEDPNIGVVPLLHANVQYRFNEHWGSEFDIDALASPQGRAVDAILMGTYQPRNDMTWRLGYRTLEGGGDGSSVYSFAWLHFGMLGVSYQF
ncbi:hypothetical protein E4656_00490 [Natronospirillum operosum]|uniref:Outer membrane protein beta-barrel domain-containing protein n=1 Tax=Natronospirillum operosum TaxID=2759953 RepID=A0A4Z0WHV8_9GAMM|nr:hypothetical protein [Natronospirillum operosum]TGG94943.1 hypothetical protein E4656_00490 [Natronospirillum operosum]